MKAATLHLYYFVKFFELALTTMMTALILSSGSWLVDKIREQNTMTEDDVTLICLAYGTMLLVLLNLFFNTLLSNLRLLCKMNCVTFGFCSYDIPNCLCLFKCCRKPCENNYSNGCGLVWLFIKWAISIAAMIFTI